MDITNCLTLGELHLQTQELLKTQSPHTPTDLMEINLRDYSGSVGELQRVVLTTKDKLHP